MRREWAPLRRRWLTPLWLNAMRVRPLRRFRTSRWPASRSSRPSTARLRRIHRFRQYGYMFAIFDAVWGAFAAPRITVFGKTQRSQMDSGGESKNEVWTDLVPTCVPTCVPPSVVRTAGHVFRILLRAKVLIHGCSTAVMGGRAAFTTRSLTMVVSWIRRL